MANPANVAGMARYGINTAGTLGVQVCKLRRIAKQIGRDADLAERLWQSGIHEARLLSSLIDDPLLISPGRLNRRVRQLDSWDVCDLFCNNIVVHSPHAWTLAVRWAAQKAQFVRRAGFTLMACLAVHDKKAKDGRFRRLFGLIERAAGDERNFVKKAVNWALRQIGKRNMNLNRSAKAVARRIARQDSRPARWIARDALAELASDKTLKIIARRSLNCPAD
ncbi:MAG: DNA alkylation repair protein [Planctomycetes bacterium]|nr:DNA alkylation repair protein [Planctomycetota bacterium]